MRVQNYGSGLLLISLLFISCSVKGEIKNEIFSPNGSFKLIELTEKGDTPTEVLSKVFRVRKDNKLRHNSRPILITLDGNILNMSWIDNKTILINVKSESLIQFQVVKAYTAAIIVESQETD